MIFDIEEFAIYDGPGIRTTVFFKGCPLRCIWCHNPEGLSKKPELTIKSAMCDHCGRCEAVCEYAFNRKLCSACGHCIDECPKHIRKISGYEITAG
ncbi:MAG: 4Fe-4S cluster-binding domain-containing protein, partial [Oscillospiraceae bacterium]|nr:4Fe-4S cluster-binding domain-containing protein [Oscillospiraceae bacterium]